MKGRKLAVFLAVGLMVSTVAAHEFDMDMIREGNMEHLQDEANAYEYPDFLGSVIGNQTINVRVESENSTETVGAELQRTRIEELQIGELENATLEVSVTADTVSNITASEEPIRRVSEKVEEGEINYETEGFFNGVKFYIAKQALLFVSDL